MTPRHTSEARRSRALSFVAALVASLCLSACETPAPPATPPPEPASDTTDEVPRSIENHDGGESSPDSESGEPPEGPERSSDAGITSPDQPPGPRPSARVAAPTWPLSASITLIEASATSLSISWPSAESAGAVGAYEVFVDGAPRQSVTGEATATTITELPAGESFALSVQAIDLEGQRSSHLAAAFSTLDGSPPRWLGTPMLQVNALGETTTTLSWSPAKDKGSKVLYQLWVNDLPIAEGLEATTLTLDDLEPMTTYSAKVLAADEEAQATTSGPEVTWTTLDLSAPAFPPQATLVSALSPEGEVALTWPPAADNVEVTQYRVLRDNVVLQEVSGSTLSVSLVGALTGAMTTFTLLALDASGNLSEPGLSTSISAQGSSGPAFPPGSSLIVSALTPTSATLAWTAASDDLEVTGYLISLDGAWLKTVNGLMATLEDLTPSTLYEVRVEATDAMGQKSVEGLSATFETPDHAPPLWADGSTLTIEEIGPSSVTLSWPEANDDVGVAVYELRQGGVTIASFASEQLEHEVTGLSPWTTYSFELRAKDAAGNLSYQGLERVVKTTDGLAPTWGEGALEALEVTQSSLTLGWPTPTDDVAVTAIRITIDGEEAGEAPGDATALTLTGLPSWTTLSVQALALDAANNESPPLTLSVQTEDASAPTWPPAASLIVTMDEGSATATLAWPEAIDEGELAAYALSIDGVESTVLAAEVNAFTLTELEPGQVLLLTIEAFDAAGNRSSPLAATLSVPDLEAPTWPEPFLSWSATETSVKLTWSPAADNVGVASYRVYLDQELLTQVGATSATITGLSEGTNWTFSVQAGDASGNWSEDGPSATATTEKTYDPGFRRLSRAQYNATLAELMAPMWPYCDQYNEEGAPWIFPCKNPWSAQTWQNQLESSTYGTWEFHAKNYPRDERIRAEGELRGGHARLDNRVFDSHATAWTSAAMTVATVFFEDPSVWNGPYGFGDDMVLAPCVWDNEAGVTTFESDEELRENCISNFIFTFGKRAFRRPLTWEQHDALMQIFYEDVAQYNPDELQQEGGPGFTHTDAAWRRIMRNLISTILSSPYFLYHIELGDEAGKLTAHELANRLSYHFWNRPPDEELMAHADDNSLIEDDALYAAQVQRLASSPLALTSVEEFYAGYFRTEDVVDISAQSGAGGIGYHKPYPNGDTKHVTQLAYFSRYGIGEAMKRELINLGAWYTWHEPGSYEDMFRSNKNFLECQVGSGVSWRCSGAGPYSYYVYGQPDTLSSINEGEDNQWCVDEVDSSCADLGRLNTATGYQPGTTPQELPGPHRHGLLTRMSFLAHDTNYKRPIRRGLKIREMLLCDPIPPPENCDVVRPPNVSGHCEDPEGSIGGPCNGDQQCNQEAGETCINRNLEVELTVREKVELITEEEGTSCYNCHATTINGLGYALGHYSSEGRYQDKEPMFSDEKKWSWGKYAGFAYSLLPVEQYAPINDTGHTLYQGEWVEIDGAQSLADFLLETGSLEWCWSREYFRFAFGRLEREEDMPAIEAIADTLRQGASLAEAFKAVAFTPQFRSLNKPNSQQGEVQP